MKTIQYETEGTCSDGIEADIEDGIIRAVRFSGGCSGNLRGIERLVEGLPVEEAVKRLKGIPCGENETSCPDQLARALARFLSE